MELRNCALLAALLGALWPAHALASDGVLEINQACVSTCCFDGDEPGFPIEITRSGSYRFTSNVTFSVFDADQASDLVVITASDVTLDLAGFALSCFKSSFLMTRPGRCSGVEPGGLNGIQTSTFLIGLGIEVTPLNVTVRNGTVRGMAAGAIELHDGEVDGIRALDNGNADAAIDVRSGQVRNCRAVGNGTTGILVSQGVVDGCFAVDNDDHDIRADGVRNSTYESRSVGTANLGGNLDLP